MILTYRILTTILYPFFLIIIFFRKILNKEDKYRYKEKILSSHFKVKRKKNTKLIWFHAASLGELKSIIPIIKELDNNNNLEFLITTVTLSSSNLAALEFKNFQTPLISNVTAVEIKDKSGKPGEVLDESLVIACCQNSIQIIELQREGKKAMSANEFLIGNKVKKGTKLN